MNRLIKLHCSIIATLACVLPISAAKPNVLIDYFQYRTDIGKANATQLRNFVMQGIQETERVDLIDVSTNSLLALEEERRSSGADAAGDPERLKMMSQQGANALIAGEVTSLSVKEHYNSQNNSRYYDAVVAYTLKVIDPNSGKVTFTKSFNHGNELLNLQTSSTPDEAVVKVCKLAVKNMRSFIEEAFPVIGTILELNEVKNNKEVKSAYISLGSDNGVSEGNRLEIFVERQIAGRTSMTVIGEMEIEAVEGADISLAKVKKGGKKLKEALDKEQKIVLKSKPKKENIFSGFSL